MERILCVVGARPNFMKMAPVVFALRERGLAPFLVHTGQHYDRQLSQVFFDELGMPAPDLDLGVGSDSHARQTARVMTEFEQVCEAQRAELVIVAGDVNSTLAAALVAAKLHIPVAHVEAGLRSYDRAMPEELNRILTDQLSDLCFTTEHSGSDNLRTEGFAEERVHFVGNCMVDTLLTHAENAVAAAPWRELGLEPGEYALATLHRPSNVDRVEDLERMVEVLERAASRLPVLFPVHPRTRQKLADAGIELRARLMEPQPYLTFLGLMARARVVLTDSGGIQEETTVLGTPCLTLRQNTERPVTIETGTNRLVGTDPDTILGALDEVLANPPPEAVAPPLWDGRAGQRIAEAIVAWAAGPDAAGAA
nr:UDP-2,3-diacetamido-2,3-dideoxy-D-glucuronate 2-epimerase-like [Nerophis lumbriciformis]